MEEWSRGLFGKAAENGIFWMILFLGTLGVLSLFSAGRQVVRTGGGRVLAIAEGRNHKSEAGVLPICSVDNGKKQAVLTFHVERGTDGVREILQVLEQEKVLAAFFVPGGWADAHKELLKEIGKQGHDIAVLGGSTKSLLSLKEEERQMEIRQAAQSLEEQTGKRVRFFCPLQGIYDEALVTTVCGMGYWPVRWNVDSEDWKDYGAEAAARQVLENPQLEPGSIIRFHAGARYAPEAVSRVIAGLKEQGYEVISLSGMVLEDHYRLDETGRQYPE